jgi:hypothetical protein
MDERDGGKEDGESLYALTIFLANSAVSGLWPFSSMER